MPLGLPPTLVKIPGFCFSRLADFVAQYGKLGVFGVEELFLAENLGLLLAIEPKLTNVKKSTF